MAEYGLTCAACERQTLHRRAEPSHVLWAILTLFSCGVFGIVWLFDSVKERPWLCTQCGTAWADPERQKRPPSKPMSAWARKALLALLALCALGTVGFVVALVIATRPTPPISDDVWTAQVLRGDGLTCGVPVVTARPGPGPGDRVLDVRCAGGERFEITRPRIGHFEVRPVR